MLKKKVYVVYDLNDMVGAPIVGVFETKEKAIEVANRLGGQGYYQVRVHELNVLDSGNQINIDGVE